MKKLTHSTVYYQDVVDGYEVRAKIFEKPSNFGIDGGCISKLLIHGNGEELNYDRGWVTLEPYSDAADYSDNLLAIYTDILNAYN